MVSIAFEYFECRQDSIESVSVVPNQTLVGGTQHVGNGRDWDCLTMLKAKLPFGSCAWTP